ncbi:hypothetical protein ACROYT_G040974 [Oculina patagonica]
MDNNETKSPLISERSTTADKLKINCVMLAENLRPVKFEDSKLVPAGQAKELLRNCAQDILRRKAEAEIRKKRIAALNLGQQRKKQKKEDDVFEPKKLSYNNHWKLRTSPDDWWFCVIKRVASAIDRNAKKESVRKMFVDHEGKKTIEVTVPNTSIYTVDYSNPGS